MPFPLGSPLQQSGCDSRFVHLSSRSIETWVPRLGFPF
ncbi:hypothetical protein RISK_005542 [Rhodopirellula islandica]|uniref:Uncharacterized protein n=1 Tax=Rhodopirellula islandica TaxID=595434 RepID=A0A0J1B7R5_RHOIS|nr:hypothetical protein RISK_005542 [Rhodopirellula islandica]